MSQIKVTFPDGASKSFASGISVLEVAKSISERLAKVALVAEIDGQLVDLSINLEKDSSIKILTEHDHESLTVYRHSTAHLLALAVTELFPETKLGIGPPIENGFYYDFQRETPFTTEELKEIEQKMYDLIKENHPFELLWMNKTRGLKWFSEQGANLKCELIEERADNLFSCYKVGSLIDFCKGPHIPSLGKIKAVKLLSVAGAYWKGDETNQQLQRIYGTVFYNKKDLSIYLNQLEEAKKRDHRRLGKELDLFSMQAEAGPGLVFWHPNGALIRTEIENFWRDQHLQGGYEFVFTPHIAKKDLWRTSGHVDFYRENMYSSIEIDDVDYQLKPMNCPFHILIYKNNLRSYRDLPLRFAETGTVYRYERSGVLQGLLRVRGFTQDDAHIFCQPNIVQQEISRVLEFTLSLLRSFGFNDFEVFLATQPKKHVGSPEDWKQSTQALKRAVESHGLSYNTDEGGGAFYGPKIDLKIKDAIGRSWQCTTIQFDFNLPERFDLSYVGEDGKSHRPYMIHRALLGSLERFFGILIEHYAGAFPFWLAPIQIMVLPISDRHNEMASRVESKLTVQKFRVKSDLRNEKVGAKIRRAQIYKIPYMIIIGDEEVQNDTLSVRNRFKGNLGIFSFENFLKLIQDLRDKKSVRP